MRIDIPRIALGARPERFGNVDECKLFTFNRRVCDKSTTNLQQEPVRMNAPFSSTPRREGTHQHSY